VAEVAPRVPAFAGEIILPLVASVRRLRRAKPAGLSVRSAGAFRLSWATSPRSHPGPERERSRPKNKPTASMSQPRPPRGLDQRPCWPSGVQLQRDAGEQVIDRRGVVTPEALAPEEPTCPAPHRRSRARPNCQARPEPSALSHDQNCDTEHDPVGLAGLEPADLILIRDHRVRAAESGHAGGLNHRAERC